MPEIRIDPPDDLPGTESARMTEDDKAFLLQELIRVHRMYRAGKAVDEDAHVWIEQQYAALQKEQIAEAMRGGGGG